MNDATTPGLSWGRDRLRIVVIGGLVIVLAYFIWRGPVRGWLDSGDLAVGFSAGSAWLSGSNPYDVAALQDHLQLAGGGERLVSQLERLRNVYFPTTLPFFALLGFLAWMPAQLLWLVANVVAAVFVPLGLARLLGWDLRSTKAIALTAVYLGLAPVHTTIAAGQSGLVASAGLVAALLLQQSGRSVSAGVMYGVATLVKAQIGLPFLAYLVWRRRWRTVGTAGIVLLGLSLVSLVRMEAAGVPWLPTWMANLALLSEPGGVNDPGPLNPDRYSLINLQYPLYSLLPAGWVEVFVVGIVGLAAIAVVRLNRQPRPRADLLAVASVAVLGLLVTYHRYYDAVLLAFPIAWAVGTIATPSWRPAVAVLLLSADFIVPAQTALHDLEQRAIVPVWLLESPVWEVVLTSQHSWALVLMAVALLWGARLKRSTDEGPAPAGEVEPAPPHPA